ncbi:MAG TPA: plastocyanin/azurin family copper-binding protein [Chitinophagales bacterium]|nr:plastocyanin/azurin family copper-binding protein [Chitinophagales bacterium]
MKNTTSVIVAVARLSFIFIATLMIINGCGGGNKHKPTEDTTSAYTPENASSAYDPAKIDATAPVMEVKLDAIGNSMDVMTFSMQEIRVKAGTTVKLHFTNTAKDPALKHNFFIVKTGTMEQVATEGLAAGPDKNYIPDDKANILYSSKVLEPGQSEDLMFPAPPIGEYQFVCTYPGHWQKMNGKFIVE